MYSWVQITCCMFIWLVPAFEDSPFLLNLKNCTQLGTFLRGTHLSLIHLGGSLTGSYLKECFLSREYDSRNINRQSDIAWLFLVDLRNKIGARFVSSQKIPNSAERFLSYAQE